MVPIIVFRNRCVLTNSKSFYKFYSFPSNKYISAMSKLEMGAVMVFVLTLNKNLVGGTEFKYSFEKAV